MPMSHLKQRCALSLAVARAISVGFRSFNGHLHFALPALLASVEGMIVPHGFWTKLGAGWKLWSNVGSFIFERSNLFGGSGRILRILSHTKAILGAWNCERILFSTRQMNVISPSPPPPIKNEKTHVRFSTRRLVNDSDRLTALGLNPLPGLACNINRCLAPSLALEHWVPEPTPFQMGCGVPQSTWAWCAWLVYKARRIWRVKPWFPTSNLWTQCCESGEVKNWIEKQFHEWSGVIFQHTSTKCLICANQTEMVLSVSKSSCIWLRCNCWTWNIGSFLAWFSTFWLVFSGGLYFRFARSIASETSRQKTTVDHDVCDKTTS